MDMFFMLFIGRAVSTAERERFQIPLFEDFFHESSIFHEDLAGTRGRKSLWTMDHGGVDDLQSPGAVSPFHQGRPRDRDSTVPP